MSMSASGPLTLRERIRVSSPRRFLSKEQASTATVLSQPAHGTGRESLAAVAASPGASLVHHVGWCAHVCAFPPTSSASAACQVRPPNTSANSAA